VATALFVTFLWSSSWVLIRWGLDDEALEPITFAALRYGLAAAVLLGWVAGRGRARAEIASLNLRMLGQIVVLGVVFYAVTQGAQFVAIDAQPAATTSVVLSWTPLVVALLGGWSIAESSSGRQFAGAVLVAFGAWWFFAGDLGATAVGMVAAFVGLGANAASALLGRTVNRDRTVSPVVVTALSMAVGAVLLVVVGVIAEGAPSVSLRGWLIIVWLAVVNTALAFTLWNRSLRRLTAIESAAINNTMLIQIAILAWIFLGETLGVGEIVGIVLVSVGVFLTQVGGSVGRANRPTDPGTKSRR
jgi:drug/metabolite transporter (DMT)-like permease